MSINKVFFSLIVVFALSGLRISAQQKDSASFFPQAIDTLAIQSVNDETTEDFAEQESFDTIIVEEEELSPEEVLKQVNSLKPVENAKISIDQIKVKEKPKVNSSKNKNEVIIGEIFEQPTFENIGAANRSAGEVVPDSAILTEGEILAPDKITYPSNHINSTHDSILKKRMDVLNDKTPFDLIYNDEVKSFIKMYLDRKQDLVAKMGGLSQYYFPIFEEALDREAIPLELKNLSVIESALNPKARSRVGAAGLWQFMLGTGRMYNLHTDSYVDERFDPKKSSEAAAKYLKQLYNIYGDWNLALAAYNYGPGNVNKAIYRSGGKRNYWELRYYMPRETRNYVAAFIAANYVMAHYKDHDIDDISLSVEQQKTDTINVKRLLSFDLIAEKLDISKAELQFLNPSYKLDAVPASTKSRNNYLTLPADKALKFAQIEKEIYAQAAQAEAKLQEQLKVKIGQVPAGTVRYTVRSGDTLSTIASKYKVTVSQIKKWNNMSGNTIRVGQRLLIHK